jgi:hypothetical protein
MRLMLIVRKRDHGFDRRLSAADAKEAGALRSMSLA